MYQLENVMHNGDAVAHPSQPEVVPIRLLAAMVQVGKMRSSDPSSSQPGWLLCDCSNMILD